MNNSVQRCSGLRRWSVACVAASAVLFPGCAALSPDTDQDQRIRDIVAETVEQRQANVSGGAATEADTTTGSGNVANVTNDPTGYIWIAGMLIAAGFIVSPTIRGLFELRKAHKLNGGST